VGGKKKNIEKITESPIFNGTGGGGVAEIMSAERSTLKHCTAVRLGDGAGKREAKKREGLENLKKLKKYSKRRGGNMWFCGARNLRRIFSHEGVGGPHSQIKKKEGGERRHSQAAKKRELTPTSRSFAKG